MAVNWRRQALFACRHWLPMGEAAKHTASAELRFNHVGEALEATLSGDWLLGRDLPSAERLIEALDSGKAKRLYFDAGALASWDTGLLTLLVSLRKKAEADGVSFDDRNLPEGAKRLLALSFAVRERSDTGRGAARRSARERLGLWMIDLWQTMLELLRFVGEVVLAYGRLLRGQSTYRRQDMSLHVQEAGVEALPIVALISALIGMIFAFVGIVQLNLFGAGIFTADLVAVAMIREIAAIMTAIIMAGRTGAAYAAEIGTMKVNEEVDALTTLGINPLDYLVMPRITALILMMPLLTMFSSLMGIIGGMIVGLSMLDVSIQQYVEQTIAAVRLKDLFGGLFKSVVYGSLVALAGCLQGMACGNSAMAVGVSTTKAVVMSIVLVVVSASVLTMIYINLGI